jgi:hypothetical protein
MKILKEAGKYDTGADFRDDINDKSVNDIRAGR